MASSYFLAENKLLPLALRSSAFFLSSADKVETLADGEADCSMIVFKVFGCNDNDFFCCSSVRSTENTSEIQSLATIDQRRDCKGKSINTTVKPH